MPELATAWVTIAASTRGMERDIRRVFDGVDGAKAGQKVGRQFSDSVARETRGMGSRIGDFFDPSIQMAKVGRVAATALKGAMLAGVAGVGATIAGTMGAALFKGFDRLRTIDDATFKLKALGNSTADVKTIMDSALKSVKGTAFGLGDAATVAANAVAAGVKPGQELTKYLTMTADASAVAGTSLSDMGRIINNVRTGQKAYNEDLNQLADRGIPIYQWIGDAAGVAAGDVKQMATDGKISSQLFEQAIQQHIGGAALTMGQSFSGSVQNAEAALGRLGAAFLKPAFTNAAGGLGSITDGLDKLTAWVDNNQGKVIGFWESLGSALITGAENFAHGIGGMMQALGDLIGGIGNVKGALDTGMEQFARLRGDNAAADAFHKSAQEAYGWGESIRAAGDKLVGLNLEPTRQALHGWADAADEARRNAEGATGPVTGLGTALGAIPMAKTVKVDVDTAPAEAKMQSWFDKWKSIIAAPPTPTPGPPIIPSLTDPNRPHFGGRASGGPISGPGGPKSDIIPIWASDGEHMLSARDVNAMGGQGGVAAFRNALHRGGGGPITWMDWAIRDPRGVDPHGGKEGGRSLGPFAPWWDMDWMPPEHPEKVGPSIPGVEGKWWHRGPVGKDKITGGGTHPWAPPIGKYRPPLPGDFLPGMIPDPEIKWFGSAAGGPIRGPGGSTADIIPLWASNGEHMLSARDVAAMGGHGGVAAFRSALHRAGGGPIGADNVDAMLSLAQQSSGRTSYAPASDLINGLADCSGAISDLVEILQTGKTSASRLFTTTNFANDAAAARLGFLPGYQEGAFNVGVNPYPGMSGHMAATLPNGVNFEAGGGTGGGAQYGGSAAGALDPQFEKRYYLPIEKLGKNTGGDVVDHYIQGIDQGASDATETINKGGGAGGGGAGGGESLGQSIVSGILQTIGLDGSVFSNPLEWPNVKSAMAAVNFGGGLLKAVLGGTGETGATDPLGSGGPALPGLPGAGDFLKPLGIDATTPKPGTPASGAGTGPLPGPAGPSYVIQGNVGMDPRDLTQRFDSAQNQAYRRNLASVKP